MAKKLGDISSSSKVNEITIKYNGETFKFRLNEELSISEKRINEELKEHPSKYGFLLLLRNKLLTLKEDAEREQEKIFSERYQKYSSQTNTKTGRPYADKNAREMVYGNKEYNKAVVKAIQTKQDYNDIHSCVIAFESRASLIQTLAANLRREN